MPVRASSTTSSTRLVKDDDGDRLTRHLLRLEREIRVLLERRR